jgi:hypothetical protein
VVKEAEKDSREVDLGGWYEARKRMLPDRCLGRVNANLW